MCIVPFRLQGLEKGLETGLEKATVERNTAFVKNLLLHTAHADEEIAQLVNVPVGFVRKIKETLQKS